MSRYSRRNRMAYFRDKMSGPIEALHPVSGKTIVVDPQRDSMIGSSLDRELRRLPGLLSWYISLRDVAETALKEAKHRELNAAEDLSVLIRTRAEERGDKLKETEIRMRVKTHKKMRKAYRRRMDAEARLRRLESAVVIITEKKWILRIIVDNKKNELYTPDNL